MESTTVTPTARKRFNLSNLLIGQPLETRSLAHQVVSKKVGLAVFASDAISSTAYATEEILVILALAGAAAFSLSVPIALAIAILLVIVTVSYRQTIFAYPNGGGAYIVARDNLGEVAAQIAGAALLTDYILTVAVSISSGVAQIVSAFPGLVPFRVAIAVSVIGFMTLVNLRGVRESGTIFAIPTYFFLGMMFLTLGIGFYRWAAGTLPTVSGVEEMAAQSLAPLGLFLILRAFSSGSTALTGIEAISNGITAFREPRSRNAARTLVFMSTVLITLFLGITLLARHIRAVPSHQETIISQLARTIFGGGSVGYLLLIAGTALVLLMAANTSYADFPRLAALHAGDGFLPRQLTYRGGRLVFSWGIMTLALAASVLVVLLRASTTALIPLYAIGVFLSFSISQTGMVVRLRKISKLKPGEVIKGLETTLEYDPHWRIHMAISAVGAVCTFVVMFIFAITKFMSGAWFILLLIPTLVFIFFRIHHHYKDVSHALSLANGHELVQTTDRVITVLLVDGVHMGTLQMVNFAKSMGNPWHAIHVGVNHQRTIDTQARWDKYVHEGELVIIPSPYRHLVAPIREYVIDLLKDNPDAIVHVVMGHLSMDSLMTQALHQNSSLILNVALSGLERVVVTIVPVQIHQNGGEVNGNVLTGSALRQAREARQQAEHSAVGSAPDQT